MTKLIIVFTSSFNPLSLILNLLKSSLSIRSDSLAWWLRVTVTVLISRSLKSFWFPHCNGCLDPWRLCGGYPSGGKHILNSLFFFVRARALQQEKESRKHIHNNKNILVTHTMCHLPVFKDSRGREVRPLRRKTIFFRVMVLKGETSW